MNIRSVWSVATTAAAFSCSAAFSLAAEPAKEDAALASKLISAHEKVDFEAFVADSGAPLKKEQFDAIATKLAPSLQAGHEVLYFGVLNQRGNRVTLWKISFKDGSDDILVTLSVRDGKVTGFLLR